MKNRFTVLVVGGARSGKSTFARELAERNFRSPMYLATAEKTDAEMCERIELHRKERGDQWRCVEAPLDLAGVLNEPGDCDGILLDCITVWLGNVLHHEGEGGFDRRKAGLLAVLPACEKSVVVVTNELGQGIVPADAETRRFRDLAGWLNQDLAKVADAVVLVSCGLPSILKGKQVIEQMGVVI